MYNSEQKNRFMDAINLPSDKRSWARVIFDTTQKMEEDRGVDLAMLSGEDVGNALCSTGAMSSITIKNRIPFVIRYKKWCAENGIDTVVIKPYEIVVDFSDSIRETMVYSPLNLFDIIHRAFPDKEGVKTVAPIYRAYLWFAFAGLYEVDAAQVKSKDINFRACVVHYGGRWYQLQPEGLDDIRAAINLDACERVMENGEIRRFRRAEGDEVIRGRRLSKTISPERYVLKTLRTTIQTYFKQAGHPGMSYVKIRKSGLFYQMLDREVHGMAVNFYTFAVDDFERDKHSDNVSENMRRRMITRTANGYKQDYISWKKAFTNELKEEFDIDKLP